MFDKIEGDREDGFDLHAEPDATFLKEISTAALTKLLIKKGVLTPSEILQQERELRLYAGNLSSKSKTHQPNQRGRVRQWASKRRWSRRLTKSFLGWKWKKIHHE